MDIRLNGAHLNFANAFDEKKNNDEVFRQRADQIAVVQLPAVVRLQNQPVLPVVRVAQDLIDEDMGTEAPMEIE